GANGLGALPVLCWLCGFHDSRRHPGGSLGSEARFCVGSRLVVALYYTDPVSALVVAYGPSARPARHGRECDRSLDQRHALPLVPARRIRSRRRLFLEWGVCGLSCGLSPCVRVAELPGVE